MNKELFIKLANLFESNGFKLFMVGGTSRDYLLNKEIYDYDFVSDAKIEDIVKFLPDVNLYSAKYGSCHIKIDDVNLDITTLRKESDYLDFRHPSKIEFVKDIKEDYIRRDFTINAIYIDKDFNVYDFCDGLSDIKNKIIRFIGDPKTRIKEDPLRILRAKRFANNLNFTIEKESLDAINKYEYLLEKINKDKIKEELSKFKN